jgi:hypothetical protein
MPKFLTISTRSSASGLGRPSPTAASRVISNMTLRACFMSVSVSLKGITSSCCSSPPPGTEYEIVIALGSMRTTRA